MRLFRASICMVFLVAGGSASLAQGLDVDWKLYGGAQVGGESLCFYDAKGLTQQLSGHVRIWTKCLLKGDLDIIMKKDPDRKIVEAATEKVLHGYVPPVAKIQSIDDAIGAMVVTRYEEIANLNALQPQSRIFYELNCRDRMLRELSTDLNLNGQTGCRDKPSDWKYAPPEGNVAALLKLVCQPQ
jgi:hypothetical protein